MTSGSRAFNYEYQTPGTVGKEGWFGTKTWSGTDSPRKTKRPPRRRKVTKRLVEVRYGRELRLVEVRENFLPPRDPPKRARKKSENPYSASGSYRRHVAWVVRGPAGYYYRFTEQGNGSYANPSLPSFPTNEYNSLLGTLIQKMQGSSFNAGVALAEAPKALKMITANAERINAALHMLRLREKPNAIWRILVRGTTRAQMRSPFSRRFGNSRTWASDLSDVWLQMQYGWYPLVSDVYNAAIWLAHLTEAPFTTTYKVSRRIKGGGSYTEISPANAKVRSFSSYTQLNIKAVVKEKSTAQLAGLLDPLSVAWELLPYSFVVDWFIPIGNYLQARNLSSGTEGTFVVSTLRYASVDGLVPTPRASPYSIVQDSAQDYREVTWSFSRTVSTALRAMLPAFTPLSEVLNWRRAASALALLIKGSSKDVLPTDKNPRDFFQ